MIGLGHNQDTVKVTRCDLIIYQDTVKVTRCDLVIYQYMVKVACCEKNPKQLYSI